MKYIFILLFFLYFNHANAQRDSTCKYIYTFRPDTPTDKASIVIDSFYNTKHTSLEREFLTSIQGEIKNSSNKPIENASIYLYANNKVVWVISKPDGIFYRPVKPGNYQISIAAAGYKSITHNFSIGELTTIHFNISLAGAPSLDVYEIHSKIKLTQEEINKIRKCAVGRDDFYKCGNRNVYQVVMQI